MASARRTLERVPGDKFDWRPHEKSGTMLWLAGHLANIPTWATMTIDQDEMDLSPRGESPPPPEPPANVEALLATFDKNVTAAGTERSWECIYG